jgi:hypothetical protein
MGDIYLNGDIFPSIATLESYSKKIDNIAVDGLSGVSNSLAYKVHEIEKHCHNVEKWYGNSGVLPLNGNLLIDSFNPFRITAGVGGAQGTEVLIHDGTVIESGSTTKKFDFHKIWTYAASVTNKLYQLKLYAGTTTFAASTQIGDCITVLPAGTIKTSSVEFMCSRMTCNNKIWVNVSCETNGGTIDILVGLHTYSG